MLRLLKSGREVMALNEEFACDDDDFRTELEIKG
jgi:hypothetical protein